MKKLALTVITTVILGCFFGKAQTRSVNGVINTSANPGILTTPANISQLQVEGKLVTQNSFTVASANDPQATGNFGATAR